MSRLKLASARTWVVKVGSSLVTDKGRGLDRRAIAGWCAQIARLHGAGHRLVLVSSGAVAEGMARLKLAKRPASLHGLQGAAAVGQMGLVRAYETAFAGHGLLAAQILLTHDDVSDRNRYLNARGTLMNLLEMGVIPVVNENDTVATDEIRLGDNDTLGALTANLTDAEVLVILTDQDGLFESDPRLNPAAALVSEASLADARLQKMAGESRGELGRGGMHTKLIAANWAARSGASTVIANGCLPDVLTRIAAGEPIGSWLTPGQSPMTARKRWIAGQLQARGRLSLDDGAVRVLREKGSSLLAVGVRKIEGRFDRGDLVICTDGAGLEIARGLANYNSVEASRILGSTSAEIANKLGYPGEPELIHRDNLVVSSTPSNH